MPSDSLEFRWMAGSGPGSSPGQALRRNDEPGEPRQWPAVSPAREVTESSPARAYSRPVSGTLPVASGRPVLARAG